MRRKVCPGKVQQGPARLRHLRPFSGLQRPSRAPCGCLLPQGSQDLRGSPGQSVRGRPGDISEAVTLFAESSGNQGLPWGGILPSWTTGGDTQDPGRPSPCPALHTQPWKTQACLMKGGSMVPRQGTCEGTFTLQIFAEGLLCQDLCREIDRPHVQDGNQQGNIQETSSLGQGSRDRPPEPPLSRGRRRESPGERVKRRARPCEGQSTRPGSGCRAGVPESLCSIRAGGLHRPQEQPSSHPSSRPGTHSLCGVTLF